MTSEITRDFLRTLRTEIDSALRNVGAKHGVTINAGSASFTATTATIWTATWTCTCRWCAAASSFIWT